MVAEVEWIDACFFIRFIFLKEDPGKTGELLEIEGKASEQDVSPYQRDDKLNRHGVKHYVY